MKYFSYALRQYLMGLSSSACPKLYGPLTFHAFSSPARIAFRGQYIAQRMQSTHRLPALSLPSSKRRLPLGQALTHLRQPSHSCEALKKRPLNLAPHCSMKNRQEAIRLERHCLGSLDPPLATQRASSAILFSAVFHMRQAMPSLWRNIMLYGITYQHSAVRCMFFSLSSLANLCEEELFSLKGSPDVFIITKGRGRAG